MKKTIFVIFSFVVLLANQTLAFDLDRAIGAVGEVAAATSSKKSNGKKSSNPIKNVQDELLGKVDKITGKVEKKIDNVTEKFDKKLGGFEKKIDRFENKIDKIEKITDDAIATASKFNSTELAKYIAIAKKIAIALAIALTLFILLLILVFVQLLRVSCQLKKLNKVQ